MFLAAKENKKDDSNIFSVFFFNFFRFILFAVCFTRLPGGNLVDGLPPAPVLGENFKK